MEAVESVRYVVSPLVTRSWLSEKVPEDWKRANVIPISKRVNEEDPGNCRLVSLTSVLGKVMERIILEAITKRVKDKKVIGNRQHGFMKQKSCLTVPLYNEITSLVDKRRAGDGVYLDFSKAISTVSHNILMDSLPKCGIDKCTVTWIENWLNCWIKGL
ncbi:rna-directed dna polymerase from mobile element jockey- hypothetical protein [Limosa lapponica baueri]|uniref:Reverse transcriptase domain-containing protein n=1 Tax=Limosa lapponica baueri TaxID=1758121 RepID=A0A2I0U9W0_LIMLA|nr:rna-directed dna polymerase from mobile element jockey- hypothetical protein [Limosa lapponica baueri]